MNILDVYSKTVETVRDIDAFYTGVKAMVGRHPDLLDDVTGAFTAVVTAVVAKRSVSAALLALTAVRDAYQGFVKAYSDETASGAVADLCAKLKAIAE